MDRIGRERDGYRKDRISASHEREAQIKTIQIIALAVRLFVELAGYHVDTIK